MTRRKDATIVATAGVAADPGYASVSPPLWPSDTYRWDDADRKPDYDYSRTVNPNRDMLAAALAELEGAAGGVITGSGQAACLLALLLAPPGALVVAPHDCYGGTYRLIKGLADQGKLRAAFVDLTDLDAVARAMEERPAQVWIETPSNPLLRVTDIEQVTGLAKAAGALTIADNTLPTPCRQRPIGLGCDLVMHSTTKALNGHGDLFGGALLAADPAMVETLQWWTNAAGLASSAHDAWQVLRGLRTLPLRIDRQEATAQAIAEFLGQHAKVSHVYYPGLKDHPDHDLARRQTKGPGFMISFRVTGGGQATADFLEALKLVTLASSLGGFSTLICKPATMTHRGMPPEAQAEAGIAPDLLRLSVGLEEAEDLIADLERGFGAV
ncbi:MAG TPA: PLP-dependent transferase [Allosphingosinicella sp.]|nr:PLP-dependent transferase [Allosphingosinicella sp.]